MTLEQRADTLERDIAEIRQSIAEIKGLLQRLDNRLWNVVLAGGGIMVTMWVTIILAIIFT